MYNINKKGNLYYGNRLILGEDIKFIKIIKSDLAIVYNTTNCMFIFICGELKETKQYVLIEHMKSTCYFNGSIIRTNELTKQYGGSVLIDNEFHYMNKDEQCMFICNNPSEYLFFENYFVNMKNKKIKFYDFNEEPFYVNFEAIRFITEDNFAIYDKYIYEPIFDGDNLSHYEYVGNVDEDIMYIEKCGGRIIKVNKEYMLFRYFVYYVDLDRVQLIGKEKIYQQ